MATPAPKLATYADLIALPEDVRAEVLAGEVVASPSRSPRHATVQRTVSRFVGGPFHDDDGRGGPGGWWILVEVDVALGHHDIVRPDLSGWRRERLPRPGVARPIEVVPDWACEVLSPSTAARDRVAKRALYARAGVAHHVHRARRRPRWCGTNWSSDVLEDRENGPLRGPNAHINQESGSDVAALRRFARLSQTQFAKAMGISVHTLRNWEQDRRKPDGPALAFLRIAARHPRILRENLESAA